MVQDKNKPIIDATNWEEIAKRDLVAFGKKRRMNVGDTLTFIFEAARESCPYNFFGCNDEEGEHLAFELSEIEKVLGVNPPCGEVCKRGYCAYINRLAYAVGKKIIVEEQR